MRTVSEKVKNEHVDPGVKKKMGRRQDENGYMEEEGKRKKGRVNISPCGKRDKRN